MDIEHTNLKDVLSDPDGTVARRLTVIEESFFNAYRDGNGYDLVRRTHGCDFRDPATKQLVEVKSNVLTESQCNEFCDSLFNSSLPAVLAIDMGGLRGFLLLKPFATLPYFDDAIVSDRVILESSKDRILRLRFRIFEDIKLLNLTHKELEGRCLRLQNEINVLTMKKHRLEVEASVGRERPY